MATTFRQSITTKFRSTVNVIALVIGWFTIAKWALPIIQGAIASLQAGVHSAGTSL